MATHTIRPYGRLSLLTQIEADSLSKASRGNVYTLFRNCALAVLNSGSATDNAKELLAQYKDFDIQVSRDEHGLKIDLINPPENAFVEGKIIESIESYLDSVIRDIVYLQTWREFFNNDRIQELSVNSNTNLITNKVFMYLRRAGVLIPSLKPNIAVCWGGHAISEPEYEYAYRVGQSLGLRGIDVCTGCGAGIMEAPMKGSILGQVKQKIKSTRCIGLTEPSIIAAEPPNELVSDLVILPNIERRLEAFVRFAHALIVFPGGPGTIEELLYILSIKLNEKNENVPLPLFITAPEESRSFVVAVTNFLINCFGPEITQYYKVIIGNHKKVAMEVNKAIEEVYEHRKKEHDSYGYNWPLVIPEDLQTHFVVNHETMGTLDLHREQSAASLASNLRKAFSGIVSGNIKEEGINCVEKYGPFKLHGDNEIIRAMEALLTDFIRDKRFTLKADEYKPCYTFEN